MPARRITGLQRDVLNMYKRALKLVASKPIETRPAWFAFVSHHFKHPDLGGGLRRRDVGAIEYRLRMGNKMLDAYQDPGVTNIHVPPTYEWPLGWVAKGGKQGVSQSSSSTSSES